MKVALVSYLNTMPFIDGITGEFGSDELQMFRVPPAECARMLEEKSCDMALIPVGALPNLQGVTILPDFCIGSTGPVDSVFLFSQKKVKNIKRIILDPHSRTSNMLVKILAHKYWRIKPEFVTVNDRKMEYVDGSTAVVAIGDWAYKHRHDFPRAYDLSAVWQEMTGLPFVFAVWAYYPEQVPIERIHRLREALREGVENRKISASHWASEFGYEKEEAKKYLLESIEFDFNRDRHEALERFLGEIKLAGLYPQQPVTP